MTAHGEDGGNDLGTSATGMVIPGNGNILVLIHPRGHSALVSEIGNVLRHDVTEAALSLRVQGPPARRVASHALPQQVHRLLLHSKGRAGESGVRKRGLRRFAGSRGL